MPQELQETAEQTAAPETQVETTTDSAAGDSNEPQTEDKPKVTGGFQKRIDKLTREKEHWKEQALQALTAKPVALPAQEAPVTTAKPKEDDFQTHAEYVEAITDWKVNEKVKALKAEQNEERVKTHQQGVEQSFKARQEEFKAVTPDFDEVMADADTPISKALLDEIVTSDNGAALQYFLAKNPDEAERLSKLTPVALAREVGRLESRFTTAPSIKTANVSKAPTPPTPVGRTSTTATKSLDDPNISMDEYRRQRSKQNPNFDR